MTNSLLGEKICVFPYILGSPSLYITFHPIRTEFPYIYGKFCFLFISEWHWPPILKPLFFLVEAVNNTTRNVRSSFKLDRMTLRIFCTPDYKAQSLALSSPTGPSEQRSRSGAYKNLIIINHYCVTNICRKVKKRLPALKGQCHEIFCFWFFS
jgi:hypothetical protein